LARLSIENYAESREDQHALARLVERLQRQTRLQMTLGSLTTANSHHLLGVYDGKMTQVNRWLVERDWTKVISTRDPSRIVFAPTVHGLPLRDLKIWESLK
jgi:hypothetical protein